MSEGKTIRVSGTGTVASCRASGVVSSCQGSGTTGTPLRSAAVGGALVILNTQGITAINAVSGEASISALRCIVMRGGSGFVASSDDISCANAIAGISTTAASSQGASFIVQSSGVIEDGSFNWQDNLPIFFGPDGRLTQVAPLSGVLQQVAIPLASNKLEISIQTAFNL